MNIREAKNNDSGEMALLFDAYRVFYKKTSDLEAAQKFLKERLSAGDSKIYVAESETAKLIGFMQLYPLFSSTNMKKLWVLNDLFVDPGFRGKGISLLLIERAKKLVKDSGACGFFLETEKSNAIGNKLYPKAGLALNEGSNFYEWNIV